MSDVSKEAVNKLADQGLAVLGPHDDMAECVQRNLMVYVNMWQFRETFDAMRSLAQKRDELQAETERMRGRINDEMARYAEWRGRAEKAEAEVAQLISIIRHMDFVTPKADKTCDEPGITLSESVQRKWPLLRCAALQRKEGDE